MKLMDSGAEAEIYTEGDKVLKKRIPKLYRIKAIDEKLRKSRTKREKKIIQLILMENQMQMESGMDGVIEQCMDSV